jgi:hypothetical protein
LDSTIVKRQTCLVYQFDESNVGELGGGLLCETYLVNGVINVDSPSLNKTPRG